MARFGQIRHHCEGATRCRSIQRRAGAISGSRADAASSAEGPLQNADAFRKPAGDRLYVGGGKTETQESGSLESHGMQAGKCSGRGELRFFLCADSPGHVSEHHHGSIRGSAADDCGSVCALSGTGWNRHYWRLGLYFFLYRGTSEPASREAWSATSLMIRVSTGFGD